MTAHARRSPSAAPRWTRCPASVRAAEGIPNRPNRYSAEGTVLHEISAECLELGFEPHTYVGRKYVQDGFDVEITDEMADWIVDGLDWAREQVGIKYIEHRVSLERWLPGDFGTLDLGIIPTTWTETEGHITIFDWKFGIVPADMLQLKIYGLGFWHSVARFKTDCTRFRFVIYQPRIGSGFEILEMTAEELFEFGNWLADRGDDVERDDAPFIPGQKQCFYCPLTRNMGGPGCDAQDEFAISLFDAKFDDIDDAILMGDAPRPPAFGAMTPERRSYIVRHRKLFTRWLEGLEKSVKHDAVAELPTPGLKIVKGRQGDRYWKDDQAAEAILFPLLGEESFTKKLKSPTAAEKLLKPTKRKTVIDPTAWSELVDLIDRGEGSPELVPEEDPREALKSVDMKFDEEDEVDLE